MLKFKLTSSLEKAFLDDNIDSFESIKHLSALRGETLQFQLLATYQPEEPEMRAVLCDISVKGALADYAKVRYVHHMPVTKATEHVFAKDDSGIIKTAPGLYPDMLDSFKYNGKLVLCRLLLESAWIEINLPEDTALVGDTYGRTNKAFGAVQAEGRAAEGAGHACRVLNCQ